MSKKKKHNRPVQCSLYLQSPKIVQQPYSHKKETDAKHDRSHPYIQCVNSVKRNFSKQQTINLLTPNVNYSGCTAPLTSKVSFYIFIQQILVPNILKNGIYCPFFLLKMQFVS